MKKTATVQTIHDNVMFEYETYPEATVVALNARLDDFKGTPVKGNDGKEGLRFIERTEKNCVNIDGRIYLHKGRVSDAHMVNLIGIFLEALKDSTIWKTVQPSIIV